MIYVAIVYQRMRNDVKPHVQHNIVNLDFDDLTVAALAPPINHYITHQRHAQISFGQHWEGLCSLRIRKGFVTERPSLIINPHIIAFHKIIMT